MPLGKTLEITDQRGFGNRLDDLVSALTVTCLVTAESPAAGQSQCRRYTSRCQHLGGTDVVGKSATDRTNIGPKPGKKIDFWDDRNPRPPRTIPNSKDLYLRQQN